MVATSVYILILTIFSEFDKETKQNKLSEDKLHFKCSISSTNILCPDNSLKILNECDDNSSEKTATAMIMVFIVTICMVTI